MLFPIIKIKEGDREHIVGTNSHDCLYIENNAIHYLNVQCMAGTQYPDESGMYFKGNEDVEYSFSSRPEIEFMSLEEIIELSTKNMKEQTESTIKVYEAIKKHEEEKAKCEKALNDCRERTGITSDSSGKLY